MKTIGVVQMFGSVIALAMAVSGCATEGANAVSYDRLIAADPPSVAAPSRPASEQIGGKGKGLDSAPAVRERVAATAPPTRSAPPPRPPRPH